MPYLVPLDGGSSQFQERARTQFLELLRVPFWTPEQRNSLGAAEVEGLEPARAILEELSGEPLRVYREQWSDERARNHEEYVTLDVLSEYSFDNDRLVLQWAYLPGRRECLAELQEQVTRWASRWNLSVDWVFDHALSALAFWSMYPETMKSYRWASRPMLSISNIFSYKLEWQRPGESLVGFRKRAKKSLLDAFEEDVRTAEHRARAAGRALEPARYTQRTCVLAVRTHVLNQPYSRVAEDVGIDTKTLRESVEGLRRYLGLPKRQLRPGRPLGARNRHRARKRT